MRDIQSFFGMSSQFNHKDNINPKWLHRKAILEQHMFFDDHLAFLACFFPFVTHPVQNGIAENAKSAVEHGERSRSRCDPGEGIRPGKLQVRRLCNQASSESDDHQACRRLDKPPSIVCIGCAHKFFFCGKGRQYIQLSGMRYPHQGYNIACRRSVPCRAHMPKNTQ